MFWHHGTPNVGAQPEPLFAAADVAGVADALGIEQFAVMGHSGGAAYALACAALLPERVLAAVCASSLAPYHAQGLDWFAGMGAAGAAELRAAAKGRAALEDHLASAEYDPELFIPADHAALAGPRMVPSAHGGWLARRTPSAELWLRPDDGHVSFPDAGEAALGWLWEHARQELT